MMSVGTLKYLHKNDQVAYQHLWTLATMKPSPSFTVKMAKEFIKNMIFSMPMHKNLYRHLDTIVETPCDKNFRKVVQEELEDYEDYLAMIAVDPTDDEWDLIDANVIEKARELYKARTHFPKNVIDKVFNACVDAD